MLKSYGFLKHLKNAYKISTKVHGPRILYSDERNFFYEFTPKQFNSLVLRSRLLTFVACIQFYRIYTIAKSHKPFEEVILEVCLCALVATCCFGAEVRYRTIGKYVEDLTSLLNGIIQFENVIKPGNNF